MPAASDIEPDLDPDELAWLATQADVESRLVFTDRLDGQVRYRVKHGPFDDSELTDLPDRDWTLLVQDVDKHLPDFREYFRRCEFIPDWRIDDLMVSFAAPGGSVGPHKDNYDVFLVQGIGCREWRVAVEEDVIADEGNAEMSLLQAFVGDGKYVASKSDVLYLPPGVPHWGVARDRCMTYSIGMRAPELAEFVAAADRLYPGRLDSEAASPRPGVFYEDPDLDIAESGPGSISNRSLARARRRFDAEGRFNDDELARIFGSLVTDPKAWLEPERPGEAELRAIGKQLSNISQLPVHGMARIAHCADRGDLHVFANGYELKCPSSAHLPMSHLCARRGLDGSDIVNWQRDPQLRSLLDWLLRHGAFDLVAG